jgi:hypothetical protein
MKNLIQALTNQQEENAPELLSNLSGATTSSKTSAIDWKERNAAEKDFQKHVRMFSKNEDILVLKKKYFFDYVKKKGLLTLFCNDANGRSLIEITNVEMTKLEIGALLSLFLVILSSVVFLIINYQIIFLIIAAALLITEFILLFLFNSKKEKRMYGTDNICQSLLRMGVSIRESNPTVIYTQDLTYLMANTKINLQNSIFKKEYDEILLDAAKIAATVKGEIAWLIPLAALKPYDKFINVSREKDGIQFKKLIIRINIAGAKAFPVIETGHSLIFPFKHFNKKMEEDFVNISTPEGVTPNTIFWDLI